MCLFPTCSYNWLGLFSFPKESRVDSVSQESGPTVEVSVLVTKVDAATNTAQLTWWAEVKDETGELEGKQIILEVPQLSEKDIALDAQNAVSNRVATLEMTEGGIMYYPFDRYPLNLSLGAYSDDTAVPIVITVEETDSNFILSGSTSIQDQVSSVHLTLERSGASQVFVVFMFMSMWVLATFVIVHKKYGFLWPALSWMAATLFALVAFRNAAPGSPPLGVLYDAISFFRAEALIVISLVTVVSYGVIREFKATSTSIKW